MRAGPRLLDAFYFVALLCSPSPAVGAEALQATQETAPAAVRARPADLVLRHGKIVTLEPERPQAEALAARNGVIVALGDDAEVARLIGPETEVIDLAGALAI